MVANFQKAEKQLIDNANSGNFSRVQLEKEQADLQVKQQEIVNYENKILSDLEKKTPGIVTTHHW